MKREIRITLDQIRVLHGYTDIYCISWYENDQLIGGYHSEELKLDQKDFEFLSNKREI